MSIEPELRIETVTPGPNHKYNASNPAGKKHWTVNFFQVLVAMKDTPHDLQRYALLKSHWFKSSVSLFYLAFLKTRSVPPQPNASILKKAFFK